MENVKYSITLAVVLYWWETWSVIQKEKNVECVENRVLRVMFGSEVGGVNKRLD
jgi:hypothetical protein